MTTEEKLENFYRHSIDSANAEAQRLVDEHQTALNQHSLQQLVMAHKGGSVSLCATRRI